MEFLVENDKDKWTILKDFADARKEVENPEKNKVNSYAKNSYADLNSVSNAAEKALNNHSMTHFHEFLPAEDGYLSIQTVIIHDKGVLKFNPLTIPVEKQNAQGMGSSITYARRYALTTNMGIIAEDDDDGNAASHNYSNGKKKNSNYGKKGNYNNGYQQNNRSKNKNNNASHNNNKPALSQVRQDTINKQNGWLKQYKQITKKSGKEIYESTKKDCGIGNVDKASDKNYEQFVTFLVSNIQKEIKEFVKNKKKRENDIIRENAGAVDNY